MSSDQIIVGFNILEYSFFSRVSSNKYFTLDALNLHAMKKTFHRCIIEAISFATHAANKIIIIEQLLIFFRAILAAAIRMNDNPLGEITTP